MLIDEFTGRMMTGRRLSEGLHQAIEAKEGVDIQPENQTLASVTIQNYFRLYDKLSGMTGTASTEAAEFQDIYKLEVTEIPTNRQIKRIDEDDVVYRTGKEKYKAIIADIRDCVRRRQPVLVGTVSIEKSEILSNLLSVEKIPHQVLNARHHEREAHIIAQAGVPGAVTVATNMAGRGTDIQLGGNLEMRIEEETAAKVQQLGRELTEEETKSLHDAIAADIAAKKAEALAAGGLYVLATERHESRRIDNQLRGRTGRQGDPGRSKFYICLEDDLLRIFAAERLDSIMRSLGIKEDEAITHKWMNKALETSQKRVEQRNFDIRKNLLKFDDVTNDQRKAIFEQRIEFMRASSVADTVKEMRHQLINDMCLRHMPEKAYQDQWNIADLEEEIADVLGLALPVKDWAAEEGAATQEVATKLIETTDEFYARKSAAVGEERMRWLEKQVLLQEVDTRWREHLWHLDQLRSVIHLRGYAQRDPLNEFKNEAFTLFERLLSDLRAGVTRVLMRGQFVTEAPPGANPGDANQPPPQQMASRPQAAPAQAAPPQQQQGGATPAAWASTPRNAPCPCGSGKRYKNCHGDVSTAARA
jgi:preprotein translocase subunit SecA